MLNLVEMFPERFVSVNREIRRNDGKARARANLRFKKSATITTSVVVPNARNTVWRSH